MKKIDTLVEDLESVIYGQGGWRKSIAEEMGRNIGGLQVKDLVSHKNLVVIFHCRQ